MTLLEFLHEHFIGLWLLIAFLSLVIGETLSHFADRRKDG